MTYKFFIDECLSPELVQMARDAGYEEIFEDESGSVSVVLYDIHAPI